MSLGSAESDTRSKNSKGMKIQQRKHIAAAGGAADEALRLDDRDEQDLGPE
jgi:hypothetical protein